ncbi:hypothetical protein [Mariprofundus sp. KV]|uniref:hypothetical protein n=1 Tax=Mariprofundus sp. KV TaxID=2608715 RepID=UPI0015A3B0CF|nr:hypothetical protein [Mariprofundus sp. KV]NWF37075.1 hypothetical protein [Mariprofundus sp. KV]
MPYTNNWRPNGLHRIFTGKVSGDEILTSNLEIHTDVRFKHIAYIINDFSEITGHSIESSHTEAYASTDVMISRTKHQLKIALLVPQPNQLELAHSYCELMREELFECAVFQSAEDAHCWVNNKT